MLKAATSTAPAVLAEALAVLATLHRLQNHLASAHDAAAASLSHGIHPMRTSLPSRVILGQILGLQGRHEEARPLFAAHLQACEVAGDTFGRALALRELGNVALETGHIDEASRHFEAAVDNAGIATWLSGVLVGDRVRVALCRGDVEWARSWQERSLTEAHRVGAPRAIASASLGLARVLRMEGGDPEAGSLLRVGGEFHVTSGDLLGLAHVLVEGALAARDRGDWETVAFALAKVESIRTSAGAGVPGLERDEIASARADALAALGQPRFLSAAEQSRHAPPDAVLDRVASSASPPRVRGVT